MRAFSMQKFLGLLVTLLAMSTSALATAQTEDTQAITAPVTTPADAEKATAADEWQVFEVKNEDESLSLALRRWAHEHRHRLIWDAGKDFPVKETTYQAADLIAAIEQVMNDTELSSFPLHACAYRNHVIRVLHISQPCVRR